MAKPKEVTLTKLKRQQVIKMFNGTKKEASIKDAKKIAVLLGVPRLQVMLLLESEGLRKYSKGSYC